MAKQNQEAQEPEETVNPLYKKGFEIAYWLRRGNSPHLEHLMYQNANGNAYDEGLRAGKKEATREQFRERMKEMDGDKEKDKDKGMDMG